MFHSTYFNDEPNVSQLFLKTSEAETTIVYSQSSLLPLKNTNDITKIIPKQNNNKFNYFNQYDKNCSENEFCGHCWLLPSSRSPNSDFVSSPETTTDSNISSNYSDFNQASEENRNLFEFSSFKNEIPLEDWELTRLTVRELNKKLAGHDRSIVSALKQKRRTLKNRGYALNCRARRLKNQQQLEEENIRLKGVINQQAKLLVEYERKLIKSEEALKFNNNCNTYLNYYQSSSNQKQHYQHNMFNNLMPSAQQSSFKESECFSSLQQPNFIYPLESEEQTTIPIDFNQMSSSSTAYSNLDFELWNSF
ncbi:bZIP_Maf domain-containing protein [Meloidogyne graminicola]|uniref:BZIP_Maf domain-containing protein n=1 Tax=Meloidogyne graminicola TaxID=189291 RepID=A0A8S9ZI06_9BILA|nr:bZIP_Maf domain-containing protein [Meloidogyne graminicola]